MLFSNITDYFKIYQKYLGRRLYIVFFLSLLAALAESLGITLLLPLIEAADFSEAQYDSAITRWINNLLAFMGLDGSMGGVLALIALVFMGKGLLKFGEGGYKSRLEANLMKELKSRMFDAYNAMDYRYYIQRNTGHFINVINSQVMGAIGSFNSFLQFNIQLLMSACYFVIAFFIAWQFTLMALIGGMILISLFKTLNHYVSSLSRKAAQEGSRLNMFLVQALQSFKYIASTGQNRHIRNGVVQSIGKLADYSFKRGLAQAFTESIREPVSVAFLIMVVAVQVVVLGGAIGPIVVVLLLFHRGMRSVINIQDFWQRTMGQIGSLEMVEKEFQATSESVEPDGTKVLGPFSREIKLQDIWFSYDQKESPVLQELSLTIPKNHTVAFVGESGAGKTTLMDLLTLMLRPSKGEIYIDGIAGKDIVRESWRTQIGYVSQETVVFDDTIANNICLWKGDYAKDPKIREKVEQAARKAYAYNFIKELPNGFETIVGDRGVRLSGGQRQRLFIARELFKKPSLLILDEATSALDTESEKYIQESIDQLKGSITVVIVAHRLSTIKNADIINILDKGRIIEKGSYLELTSDEKSRFGKMVSIQQL
jgi:ABC-type multidrug transport system fused ATPase/permease subunit